MMKYSTDTWALVQAVESASPPGLRVQRKSTVEMWVWQHIQV